MPDFDDFEIIKQFEKTLVGRVLNPAQAHRVKALLGFIPTVWRCEGRVKALDMGRGKFQFRFEEEVDLQQVLAKRPYHFDGWLFALERWVPTVRIDFPSTIPFWIQIKGLQEYRCYKEGVVAIGKKLGEILAWEVQPPRVQVVLESDAPLVLHRKLEFRNGDNIKVYFQYEKLDCYCKRCYRLTHDKRDCPERPLVGNDRGFSHRHGGDEDGRRKRSRSCPAYGLAPQRGQGPLGPEQGEVQDGVGSTTRVSARWRLFDDEGTSRAPPLPKATNINGGAA